MGTSRGRTPGEQAQPHARPGRGPAHDQVAVERRRALAAGVAGRAKRHDESAILRRYPDPVRWRLRPLSLGHPVPHHERDVGRHRQLGLDHVDPRAVGVTHATGRSQVARRHHGREPPLPGPLRKPLQPLVDRELRDDLHPRRNVPDLLCEQVRPVLFGQPGGPPFHDRLLEPLPRRRDAIHLTDDPPFPDADGVARQRSLQRQGHQVGHTQRLRIGIDESLLQRHVRQPAAGFRP